jgi:uncharacterized membrane protein/thiol-disulfide isomerase/thioredoxin
MFMKGTTTERRIGVLRWWTAALALAGVGIMAYLTSLHFTGGSAGCDFGAGFSCSTVNQSTYSEILGIPVAVLGLLYFVAVAALAVLPRFRGSFTAILLASAFSLFFGVYLSVVEHLVIDSICLYCELSKVLMVALIGIALAGAKLADEEVPLEWVLWILALAIAFSYGAWTVQRVPSAGETASTAPGAVVAQESGAEAVVGTDAAADRVSVVQCPFQNPNGSVECSGGNSWCGETCRAEPSCPPPTTRIDCGSCTCVCPDGTLGCVLADSSMPVSPGAGDVPNPVANDAPATRVVPQKAPATAAPFYEEFTQEAYVRAKAEGRPVLLYFWAGWCPICRAEEPGIRETVEAMDVPVAGFRVDFDAETAMKRSFSVPYQHTTVLLNTNGNEVTRFIGPVKRATLESAIRDAYSN